MTPTSIATSLRALIGGWGRKAVPRAESKASRAGPLIALDTLRQPAWTPRDYAAFAREGFMQNYRDKVGNIKVRTSYGIVGNQNVNDFQYQDIYKVYQGGYAYGNTAVNGVEFGFGNENIQWEKAATFNAGVDVDWAGNGICLPTNDNAPTNAFNHHDMRSPAYTAKMRELCESAYNIGGPDGVRNMLNEVRGLLSRGQKFW